MVYKIPQHIRYHKKKLKTLSYLNDEKQNVLMHYSLLITLLNHNKDENIDNYQNEEDKKYYQITVPN